jgi:predicted RNase H-like nuclease
MNVEMEWKDDSELQLMAGDRPQVNPIKTGIKPQDKSLYQFFSSISLTTKWSLNKNISR